MTRQRAGRWGSGVCVAIAIGCLGSGCDLITEKITQKVSEKAMEQAIEKETGGDVQIDKGSLAFKNDKGAVEFNSAGAKVPDTWPQDVPLYPGAKVTMTMSNEAQHVLALETPDSPEKAVAFYKDKLSSMKQEAAMSRPEQEMLVYKDANERLVQLSIGKEGGGSGPNTTIALIVTPPKKKSAPQ